MNNWALSGWFGGMFLAYGVGSMLVPSPPLISAVLTVLGAAIIGAVLGKIASHG